MELSVNPNSKTIVVNNPTNSIQVVFNQSTIEAAEVYRIVQFVSDGSDLITLPNNETFKSNSLIVWVNGILQKRGTSYTEASDRKSFTFTFNPESGDEIEYRYVVD